MSEWPQGWTGDGSGRYGRGSGSAEPEGARAMPQVRRTAPGAGGPPPYGEPPLPPDLSSRGTIPRQQASQGQDDYDDGYNTGQVYGHGHGGPGGGPGDPRGPGGPGGGPRPVRPKNWKRRITIGLVTLVVVLLAVGIGTYIWADSKLRNEVDLSKVEDRPDGGKGTNYLIVGSDSREGMSAEDKKKLHTGSADGRRTDSIILLHVGDNGNTMVSLPRDSWVTIPSFTGPDSGKRYGQSQNKLNASFSMAGPELLVRTIEYNTGLHIDHYAEIGFDGFAKIVDSVGGVEIDVPQDMKEKHAGTDLKKGKQTLDGQKALAFVRQRYGLAGGDLDRTRNQQKFLSALANKAATPSTVLNPFKLYPTMGAGLDSLIVDKDMGLWDVKDMFFAMKGVSGGEGKQMNMPVSNPGLATSKGSAVQWDMTKVKQLVSELKNDEKVTVSGN
ncbi:LCP family protein [Streptomyces hygroscopicus]|uniref:LCP family protein n=1 Tax=Streptomyces hygroscopicus TaxID=1912 RepID=UPI00082F523B|nr:LCP family protein [Streptomyces hygroscopicus]GLV79897.1 transcriptional regulator [Streptomyces hygroscopicus subsp. hygroscopicus]